jgi:hypothetical protein
VIRNGEPLAWRARGLSDTLDGSTSFNGAMALLSNLIPDTTTASMWECRPAAVSKTVFSGVIGGGPQTYVGPISAMKVIGNVAYGLIKASDNNDHPFAYNLATNALLPVTNAVGGTYPVSPATTGPWTPPIMDLIGSKLVVTHPGFLTLLPAAAFGWFDISVPTAPVWNTGNLSVTTPPTTNFFTAVPPSAVAQFYNRAYYIYNLPAQPALVFSDILNPLNMGGSSTQVLTLGDAAPLSALGQLRFYNQLGGIIQGLVVFKGAANTYQITGDLGLNNLAINSMNLATGTLSPLSVVSTPRGLGFVSPDGFRIIDFQSNISDPIGLDGQGVVAPFVFSAQPSRICAACNGNLVRISTQNPNLTLMTPNSSTGASPIVEYWYDLGRQIWHGPHTFPANVIQPWMGTFVLAAATYGTTTSIALNTTLWQSDPTQQASGSTFVENSVQMTYTYQTVFLPDTDQMSNVSVAQSLLDIQITAGAPPVQVACNDQNNLSIDAVSIQVLGGSTIWGAFQWGNAQWGAPSTAFASRILPWHLPLVFARAQFKATGSSDGGVRLGAWHLRYKVLRYLTDIVAAA